MLKFNQLPPTAETVEVDADVIRRLAYSIGDRCINNVAETCAAIIVANTSDLVEVAAIGDKIGRILDETKLTTAMSRFAKRQRMNIRKSDGLSFVHRYRCVAEWLLQSELPIADHQAS